MFANTPRGAKSSAIIYSVIVTAKENQFNPFKYLMYLFEQLPEQKNPEALDRNNNYRRVAVEWHSVSG
ncbi:hypothetical protein JCM16163A_32730 [Paenibacillus sp. YK5]